jgi:hypothetical protein
MTYSQDLVYDRRMKVFKRPEYHFNIKGEDLIISELSDEDLIFLKHFLTPQQIQAACVYHPTWSKWKNLTDLQEILSAEFDFNRNVQAPNIPDQLKIILKENTPAPKPQTPTPPLAPKPVPKTTPQPSPPPAVQSKPQPQPTPQPVKPAVATAAAPPPAPKPVPKATPQPSPPPAVQMKPQPQPKPQPTPQPVKPAVTVAAAPKPQPQPAPKPQVAKSEVMRDLKTKKLNEKLVFEVEFANHKKNKFKIVKIDLPYLLIDIEAPLEENEVGPIVVKHESHQFKLKARIEDFQEKKILYLLNSKDLNFFSDLLVILEVI